MYAVIFRSIRTNEHSELYESHSENMAELVKATPGYISHYSHRDPASRSGVTISYFESLEAIKTWREHPEHKEVQRLGRELFYSWYEIQVVKVDRLLRHRYRAQMDLDPRHFLVSLRLSVHSCNLGRILKELVKKWL